MHVYVCMYPCVQTSMTPDFLLINADVPGNGSVVPPTTAGTNGTIISPAVLVVNLTSVGAVSGVSVTVAWPSGGPGSAVGPLSNATLFSVTPVAVGSLQRLQHVFAKEYNVMGNYSAAVLVVNVTSGAQLLNTTVMFSVRESETKMHNMMCSAT